MEDTEGLKLKIQLAQLALKAEQMKAEQEKHKLEAEKNKVEAEKIKLERLSLRQKLSMPAATASAHSSRPSSTSNKKNTGLSVDPARLRVVVDTLTTSEYYSKDRRTLVPTPEGQAIRIDLQYLKTAYNQASDGEDADAEATEGALKSVLARLTGPKPETLHDIWKTVFRGQDDSHLLPASELSLPISTPCASEKHGNWKQNPWVKLLWIDVNESNSLVGSPRVVGYGKVVCKARAQCQCRRNTVKVEVLRVVDPDAGRESISVQSGDLDPRDAHTTTPHNIVQALDSSTNTLIEQSVFLAVDTLKPGFEWFWPTTLLSPDINANHNALLTEQKRDQRVANKRKRDDAKTKKLQLTVQKKAQQREDRLLDQSGQALENPKIAHQHKQRGTLSRPK